MRVKFWSDTNQQGFSDLVEQMAGVAPQPINLYEYEIPDALLPVAEEWGATVVGDADVEEKR